MNLPKTALMIICVLVISAVITLGTVPTRVLGASVDPDGNLSPASGQSTALHDSSPAGNAAYNLQPVGKNNQGNFSSSIMQIKTDSALPPVTAISAPANNAHIFNTYTVTGTATDADLSNWTLYYGAGSSPTSWKKISSGTTPVVNGTLGTWYIASFKNNLVYTLRLTATNSSGKTSQATATVTIDSSVSPFTDMFVPNNTSNINGVVTVTVTAFDTNLSKWKMDYGLGKSPSTWTEIMSGSASVVNGIVPWDTGSMQNKKEYTIRISAIDQDGNYMQTTKHLTKDTTVPTASISVPANNAHIFGVCNVTGSVSGTKLDFWELDYGAGADPVNWSKIKSGRTSVTGAALGTWDTSLLHDGSVYTLQLTVADKLGHRIQYVSQVTINSSMKPAATATPEPIAPPLTTISSPANNAAVQGTATITGTVTDADIGRWTLEFGSGTAPVQWTEINTGLTAVTNGPLGSWDTSKLAKGKYTLRLKEVDIKGNIRQTTVQVTVGLPADTSTSLPSSTSNAAGGATAAAADASGDNWFSAGINEFIKGLESFLQQVYIWITGK